MSRSPPSRTSVDLSPSIDVGERRPHDLLQAVVLLGVVAALVARAVELLEPTSPPSRSWRRPRRPRRAHLGAREAARNPRLPCGRRSPARATRASSDVIAFFRRTYAPPGVSSRATDQARTSSARRGAASTWKARAGAERPRPKERRDHWTPCTAEPSLFVQVMAAAARAAVARLPPPNPAPMVTSRRAASSPLRASIFDCADLTTLARAGHRDARTQRELSCFAARRSRARAPPSHFDRRRRASCVRRASRGKEADVAIAPTAPSARAPRARVFARADRHGFDRRAPGRRQVAVNLMSRDAGDTARLSVCVEIESASLLTTYLAAPPSAPPFCASAAFPERRRSPFWQHRARHRGRRSPRKIESRSARVSDVLDCFVARARRPTSTPWSVSTPSSCFFSAFAFAFAAFALPMTPDRFRSSRWAGAHGSAARCKSRDKPRPRTRVAGSVLARSRRSRRKNSPQRKNIRCASTPSPLKRRTPASPRAGG